MYCSQCGAAMATGVSFCVACGASAGIVTPVAGQAAVARSGAGFWKRWVALLVDGLILIVPLFILAIVLATSGTTEWTLNIIFIALWWLYFALQESSEQQATLGKRALGIIVTDGDGKRLSFWRASGRHFAAAVNYLTLYIGYAIAGLTPRKQGLHDMIANTLVVNRQGSNPIPAWAIVLLVLVVLAIPAGGILAAIAIPVYHDYSVRAKVSEILLAATPMKMVIAEALVVSGEAPSSAEAMGMSASLSNWATTDVRDGLIVIEFSAAAGNPIAGKTLALQPLLDASANTVSWICGHQMPGGVELSRSATPSHAARHTTVEPRHLPMSCR